MTIKVTRVDTWPVDSDEIHPYHNEKNKEIYDTQEQIFSKYRDHSRNVEKTKYTKEGMVTLTVTSYFESDDKLRQFTEERKRVMPALYGQLDDTERPHHLNISRVITVTDLTTNKVLRVITYAADDWMHPVTVEKE